ncbi:MAG: right-handed parallel beta-helix repeat-containing protein [Candidatus Thorarchaeota archaeon]
MRNQVALVVLLIFVLGVGVSLTIAHPLKSSSSYISPDSKDTQRAKPAVAVSYVDHGPIVVQDNEDFEDGDWEGDGSKFSPYTISGFKFNTTGIAIFIEKTTAFFKISDCLFVGGCTTTGIYLDSLENGTVENSFFTGIGFGLRSDKADSILVNGSSFSECHTGLELEKTNNTTIISSTFVSMTTAISISKCDSVQIESCIFGDNEYGVHLVKGNEISIIDSIYDEGKIGFLSEDSEDVFANKSVFSSLLYGIFLSDTERSDILNSDFVGCSYGIYVLNCDEANIRSNQISNDDYGVYLTSADLFNVTSNHIENCGYDGVNVRTTDNGLIKGNIIENNDRYGIRLLSSDDIIIYGNEIGWNDEENAIDLIGTLPFIPTNQWHDNSSLGNGYSDYTGTSTYVIPGTVASVDKYPKHILYVSSPSDVAIELGESMILEWDSSAVNPDSYRITRDSTILREDDWVSPSISIEIPDNLTPGIYHYTIWLNTTSNRVIMDSVQIVISDTTSPVWIETPSDQSIESGDDFSYLLQATDLGGIAFYWVNDTTHFSIADNLLESVGILPLSRYPIEVRAYDPDDNYCTSILIVSVTDSILPELSHPEDLEYEYGASENYIEWTFSDENPNYYKVYLNDELRQQGNWNESSDSVRVNVDGLSLGEHVFRIIIFDMGNNSVSDEVTVMVVEATTTTTTETSTSTTDSTGSNTSPSSTEVPGPDPLLIPVLILGAGIATTLVLFVLFSKREILSRG